MYLQLIKSRFTGFLKDTSGTISVDVVMTLPLMVLLLTATYEFFEAHRYRSVRDKATFTIADMISREQGEDEDITQNNPEEFITDTYIDNSLRLLNDMTNDGSASQLRISMIQFNANKGPKGEYESEWSQVRGSGSLVPLTDDDVAEAHAALPIRANGQYLLLVETESTYNPTFEVGFNENIVVTTRAFTDLRFAPQLKYLPTSTSSSDDPRDNEEPEESED